MTTFDKTYRYMITSRIYPEVAREAIKKFEGMNAERAWLIGSHIDNPFIFIFGINLSKEDDPHKTSFWIYDADASMFVPFFSNYEKFIWTGDIGVSWFDRMVVRKGSWI